MKNKTEVLHYFKIHKDKKERQLGKKIKAVQFDGGSEYKTIDFKGIIQQVSAPYTLHQNGVSERLNCLLVTMARCILFHACLPLRFWDAAILTACYLHNRLPISRWKLTPYEVMNGRKLYISHLKVWGCVCYVLIDSKDPRRYKLLPTSNKGNLIGYCESSTQFCIYIPSKPGSNNDIISENICFLENSFWNWDSSSQEWGFDSVPRGALYSLVKI